MTSVARQAGWWGESSVVPRWVSATFQVRFLSIVSAWAAESIRSSVIRAVPGSDVSPLGVAPGSVGPGAGRGSRRGDRLAGGLDDRVPAEQSEDGDHGDRTDHQQQSATVGRRVGLEVVVVHVVVARRHPAAARGAGQQRGRVRIALRLAAFALPGSAQDGRLVGESPVRGRVVAGRGASGPLSTRPGRAEAVRRRDRPRRCPRRRLGSGSASGSSPRPRRRRCPRRRRRRAGPQPADRRRRSRPDGRSVGAGPLSLGSLSVGPLSGVVDSGADDCSSRQARRGRYASGSSDIVGLLLLLRRCRSARRSGTTWSPPDPDTPTDAAQTRRLYPAWACPGGA